MAVPFPTHPLIKSALNYLQQLLRAQKQRKRQGSMLRSGSSSHWERHYWKVCPQVLETGR